MSTYPYILPEEVQAFLAQHPNLRYVDAIFPDLCGIIRGKRYPIGDLHKMMEKGVAFTASALLLDSLGRNTNAMGFGFSDGDPDSIGYPVAGSLQLVPWSDGKLARMLLSFKDLEDKPLWFEPRNILKKTVEKISDLGLRPVVAFELEFYLLDKERNDDGSPLPPISPLSGRRDHVNQVYGMDRLDAFHAVLQDIEDACQIQGIPSGAISSEYSPGQFEINLHHSDDALFAADMSSLFKYSVKHVARRHDMQATFMAKPFLEEAGNGLHIHISLLDQNGQNVFSERGDVPLNPTLKHALGGVLATLPESMAFIAPNINSYRRFQPNIFVPVNRSWAYENRSVALRIPAGDASQRRIEHRMAGADANPYLVLASILSGIHFGITNASDPGAPWEGNAGEKIDPALPMRPRRALDHLRNAKILPDYMGRKYLDLYAEVKEVEYDTFESQISENEYKWYLQAD